ncbi:hypothetical protein O6H91_08G052000 [Diphasiastrum complanatum]|uniref:Uncharacterized protein n=1 Tax=Diphasiastrum complanatum TaxID=34168 RepID=A0ACC2CXI8_DIPCM|nr:hypothetical protein O6H91_Y111600 [Diphasiastrum complanatum]KAJ7546733.1 hypothetical protein O6H91_08G052000 [Diphasiastrum complanatum]
MTLGVPGGCFHQMSFRSVIARGSHTAHWHGISAKNCCSSGKGKVQARGQLSAFASLTTDDYGVLRLAHTASRYDIKAAYRRLALQYHPDVCREAECELKFRQIKNAYESLMKRHEEEEHIAAELGWEGMFGVGDDTWSEWEEWMGFEGGVAEHSFGFNSI